MWHEGLSGAERWAQVNAMIYGLTNEHGNICYVGQTCHAVPRFRLHTRSNHKFTVSGMALLAQAQYQEEANRLERKWIAFLGIDNLFNVRKGGAYKRKDPRSLKRQFGVRLEPELLALCEAHAARAGIGFSEWARHIMRRECDLTEK